jgi:hypothetical protein
LASIGARFIFASRGRHDRKWRGRIGTQLERIFSCYSNAYTPFWDFELSVGDNLIIINSPSNRG